MAATAATSAGAADCAQLDDPAGSCAQVAVCTLVAGVAEATEACSLSLLLGRAPLPPAAEPSFAVHGAISLQGCLVGAAGECVSPSHPPILDLMTDDLAAFARPMILSGRKSSRRGRGAQVRQTLLQHSLQATPCSHA